MKFLWLGMIALLLTRSAIAEDRFGYYPATVSIQSCHELDFNSYFVAQNSKANLISLNKNLSRPNFGGKYLLLRNEMMAETIYLIADCTNGKFLKEKLKAPFKGTFEFKPDSFLVVMTDKDKDEFQLWQNGEWIRVDDPAPPEPKGVALQPQNSPSTPSRPSYDDEFKRYSVNETLSSCKPLNYDSYFRAQRARDAILKDSANAHFERPNFAGKYLLVKAQLLFETIYLIADCATGHFFPVVLDGDVHFSPKSFFVWVSKSSEFPETYIWEAPEWVHIHDPLRRNPPPIHHILNRVQSEALIRFIKHGRKDTIIRDDQLICDQECSDALPWLKLRGAHFKNLKCDTHKIECELDAEAKSQT